MSDQVRQQAEELTTAISEAAQLRLPEPAGDVVPLEQADEPTSAEIQTRMNEIDMESTGSIIGFGSRAVITGDTTQVDVPGGRSGLERLEEILGGIDGVGFVRLTARDVVRHRIVADIVDAYARAEEPGRRG